MKYTFLALAFAVATLTACAHKPAPVVTETKVVKAPAKKAHHKAPAKKAAVTKVEEKK